MKITFISNACCIYESNDFKLITDPWLIDGAFEGAWCHYPEPSFSINDMTNIDAVYISHLHPDHYDPNSLKFLDPDKPIIILDSKFNFLEKMLIKSGHNNIIKISDNNEKTVGPFNIKMFGAFSSHPFHDCKIGPHIIDSAIMISDGNYSALNANDNCLTVDTAHKLVKRYGYPTVAQLNYNAAGPYPSCFLNMNTLERKDESKRLLDRNLAHLVTVSKILKSDYIMPFAGDFVIGGKEHYKNDFAGTASINSAGNYIKKAGLNPLLLNTGQTFNLKNNKIINGSYHPVSEVLKKKYIHEVLSNIQYEYEKRQPSELDHLKTLLLSARKKMWVYQQRFDYFSDWKILIDLDSVYCLFDMNNIDVTFTEKNDTIMCKDDKILKIFIDNRMLEMILKREAHWNNVETGFHINFDRRPNLYDPDLHVMFSFFHT